MSARNQAKYDRMQGRSNYPRSWQTQLVATPVASPLYCCYATLCCWCASFQQRKQLLYGDMSRYICCAGSCPCSGRMGEQKCPELCLALESSLCFPQSVASTRYAIQDELRLMNTPFDNCVIGTMIAAQYLACVCSIAACLSGSDEVRSFEQRFLVSPGSERFSPRPNQQKTTSLQKPTDQRARPAARLRRRRAVVLRLRLPPHAAPCRARRARQGRRGFGLHGPAASARAASCDARARAPADRDGTGWRGGASRAGGLPGAVWRGARRVPADAALEWRCCGPRGTRRAPTSLAWPRSRRSFSSRARASSSSSARRRWSPRRPARRFFFPPIAFFQPSNGPKRT